MLDANKRRSRHFSTIELWSGAYITPNQTEATVSNSNRTDSSSTAMTEADSKQTVATTGFRDLATPDINIEAFSNPNDRPHQHRIGGRSQVKGRAYAGKTTETEQDFESGIIHGSQGIYQNDEGRDIRRGKGQGKGRNRGGNSRKFQGNDRTYASSSNLIPVQLTETRQWQNFAIQATQPQVSTSSNQNSQMSSFEQIRQQAQDYWKEKAAKTRYRASYSPGGIHNRYTIGGSAEERSFRSSPHLNNRARTNNRTSTLVELVPQAPVEKREDAMCLQPRRMVQIDPDLLSSDGKDDKSKPAVESILIDVDSESACSPEPERTVSDDRLSTCTTMNTKDEDDDSRFWNYRIIDPPQQEVVRGGAAYEIKNRALVAEKLFGTSDDPETVAKRRRFVERDGWL